MGTSSFQVSMDDDSSADWLLQHQGTVTQDIRKMDAYDSSSSSEMLMSTTCSTLMDRSRLIPRPQHEQSPKCPRCDSTHTKFCYYNNYSLSQPRYFCKTCRRYWTKGGTLRNIPVGGGCRKNNNKKQLSSSTTNSSSSSSKKNNNNNKPSLPPTYNNNNSSSSPILNINQQNNNNNYSLLVNAAANPMSFFLDQNINHETSTQIHDQFMDHQYQNNNFGGVVHNNIYNSPIFGSNYSNILESDCQRTLMTMPYDQESYNEDVKPININSNGGKINLSLELLHHHQQQQQQQASTTDGYNSFVGGLGSSWTGLMNGYGSSATNPLLFN
ncbi:hypothetical protein ACJIZ3_020863 [Penstemon smallii]|uniref:Dof zinc finger protein n=1 Tax=Penstemon smallii TaxID=265156 RepID=A0ABD3SJX8_9LAMI